MSKFSENQDFSEDVGDLFKSFMIGGFFFFSLAMGTLVFFIVCHLIETFPF